LQASGDAAWIVAVMHHPAFSAGYHGSDGEVREAWVPLFETYGVDLALAGHDHDYQRSLPIGDVTYVVSGGAARPRMTGEAEFTAYAASTRHFIDIGVWEDRMVVRAINRDGVFDEATLGPTSSPRFATFAEIGGDWPIEIAAEARAGLAVAGVGLAVWMLTLLAVRRVPLVLLARLERTMQVASTMGTITAVTGIALVLTLSLA
jgi:3',5'-cyclic AMP phosphodiesterase CpdA